MLETVAAVVVVLDARSRIVEFNRAAEELTGYASEEVCGREVWETGLVAREEEPGFRAAVARLSAGEFPSRYESHWVTKDGRRRLLSWRTSAVLGDDGAVAHVIATAVDVTDERRIEAELRASEERFQSAVGSLLDGFAILSPVHDESGEIVDFRYEYVNDAACRLIGLAREQLLGHGIAELFPAYATGERFKVHRRVAQTGEPARAEDVSYEDEWPGGKRVARAFDSSVVALGPDIGLAWRETTERKRAEEELRLRAERLDLVHDAVIVRDPAESRVRFWNREGQAIYGYSPAEAVGRVTDELLATVFPESREAVDDALAREGQWGGELRHTRKDGTVIVVSSRQALQRAADGRPIAIIELNSDITERKLVEVEFRRLAGGVDSSADAILSKDRDCRITSWNRGAERLYGYTASEIVGQHVGVLVPADRAGEEQGILDRALRGEDVGRYETQRLGKDGTVIDVSITVSPIGGRSGEVIGASSIHRDITEQKRAEEELRLRAERLDLVHDAVIVRDPAESVVRFWNREAQAIYGYSPAEAVGRVTHELLATVFPESRQAVDDALAREGQWGGELRHTRKDGRVIVVSSRQALQRAADGRPVAIIELNSDITERKGAELELARITGLLERTQEVSKTGGWEYDVATGKLTWTDEVYRIYGVERTSDPTEVTEAIAAFDPESAPVIDAAFRRLVAEGEPYDLELGLIRADGQRIWVRTIGRPVIEDGRVVRVGGNIADVTDRRLAEEEIRTLNAELEQRVAARTAELEHANKELETFAYSVSHDLRAPLRAVDGFSQALLEDYSEKLDEDGRHDLERVRAGAVRMGDLIDAILQLSRLSRRRLVRALVDISALASEVVAELQDDQPDRRVEVEIQNGLLAQADAALVRTVLQNLLANAYKFTFNTPHARVRFGAVDQDGVPVYFVADNGTGFDMAHAERLFLPFHRLHRETEFPGNGIGLATVVRAVRKHDGVIWAQGAVNQGATFHFSLTPGAQPPASAATGEDVIPAWQPPEKEAGR